MTSPTDGSPSINQAFLVTADGAPGLTRSAGRGRRFVAPSRGVRYPAAADDPDLSRASAAVVSSRPDAVLCDVSAARHWLLPLPPWIGLSDNRPIGVAVLPGSGHPERRGVRGRRLRLPAEHVVVHLGIRTTTPARTWLDCAALMPIEHLVAMGDVLLRRGLADADELRRMIAWGRRRRGIVAARTALEMLDPGSESPGESIVRTHLVVDGLPRPVCNMDIVVDGGWLARADLAWPRFRVIVEYDGLGHLDEQQRRTDAARRNLLQDAGWLVIVFTASDLRQPWAMTSLVRSALTSRTPLTLRPLVEWRDVVDQPPEKAATTRHSTRGGGGGRWGLG